MNFETFIKTLIGYSKIDVLEFDMEKDKYHPDEKVFFARVALWKDEQYRCPICGQKCGKYDRPGNIKRWRSLDISKNKFYIECINPRCICPEHGVRRCRIPWALPDSDYTQAFEVRVAYAAAKMPTNLVSKEYRIKWGTVGNCVRRVQKAVCHLENTPRKLTRITIDETSYQKGYKYITTVQNLETGEIIWAHDGLGDDVLKLFFESLTPEQLTGIEFVVADGARWITRQVEKFCPNAKRCVDPFHVVGWATEALDTARKRLSADAKKKRFSLLKNPENLTDNQKAQLDYLVKSNPELYAAYLCKERLRLIFKQDNFKNACLALGRWLKWARNCGILEFEVLADKIDRNRKYIVATLMHGMSTGKLEATNNIIKSIIRRSFGFRNVDNLIAMIYWRTSGALAIAGEHLFNLIG